MHGLQGQNAKKTFLKQINQTCVLLQTCSNFEAILVINMDPNAARVKIPSLFKILIYKCLGRWKWNHDDIQNYVPEKKKFPLKNLGGEIQN